MGRAAEMKTFNSIGNALLLLGPLIVLIALVGKALF
jgi:hypothetical protein